MKNFIKFLGSQHLTDGQAVVFNDICMSYALGCPSEDFEVSEYRLSYIMELLQIIGFKYEYDTEYEILTVYFD